MKKAIIAAGAALVLGLSGAAIASEPLQEPVHSPLKVELNTATLIPESTTLTKLEQEARAAEAKASADALTAARQTKLAAVYKQQLANNQAELEQVVTELLARVGNTPYVFAGSSFSGWDCSGMVLWAYKGLGIDLPHSASEQAKLGVEVSMPRVGDIVVYGDSSGYFHSAIYVGDGLLVHSGFKPGRWTELIPMDHGSLAGLNYTIRRFLDTE
jgi:cell wall-associated NlpC family hydrolase